MQGIKPMGDRVLVERLDGDGREEVRPSGLILPARDMTLRQGNTHRIPDTFRARVLAISDKASRATQGELVEGSEVLVHTYDQNTDRTLVGDETPFGLLVGVDDIIGVEDDGYPFETRTMSASALLAQSPLAREYLGAARADRLASEIDKAPVFGTVAKTEDFVPPATSRMGFR